MAARPSRRGRLTPRFALVVLVGAVAAAVLGRRVARRRRGRIAEDASRPADVGFMVAMHNAFRRDLARLERPARDAGAAPSAIEEFQREWDSLRERLHRHHAAEDDDLWPVLRAHLTAPADLTSVDRMVEEHHALSEAMDAVEKVLSGPRTGGTAPDLTAAVDRLSRTVRDHLGHEERADLAHLSGAGGAVDSADWSTLGRL